MEVIKLNGEREEFDPRKLKGTLFRAGASRGVAEKIIGQVEGEAYDGIPTRKLYSRVLELLDEYQPEAATCYDLKPAIMRLGPAGYPFETYLARVLEEYGYSTELRSVLQGRCVRHEIDVIAEKDGVSSLIEAKFHNQGGIYTGVKEALYTYARFLDLDHGQNRFQKVWLVSNTKVSGEARDYSKCMDMELLAWKYPPGRGLADLVDRKKLYPLTAMRKIEPQVVTRFSKAGYMLMKDLVEEDFSRLKSRTGLPGEKLKDLISKAQSVCEGKG